MCMYKTIGIGQNGVSIPRNLEVGKEKEKSDLIRKKRKRGELG